MKKNKSKKILTVTLTHWLLISLSFLSLFCFCVVELFEFQQAWDHLQSLRNIPVKGTSLPSSTELESAE